MAKEKQLKVSAIKNGTVIDHIPAKHLFKVINILGLNHIENQITFGTNLESKKLKYKAIIKVSEKFFENDDINRIALVAPEARLSIIKNYEVIEKRIVEIPTNISNIVKCVNPMCITNNEDIPTKFTLVSKQNVSLKCHYCEKITDQESMKII